MLAIDPIVLLPKDSVQERLLYLPSEPEELHPVHKHLLLLVCNIFRKNRKENLIYCKAKF